MENYSWGYVSGHVFKPGKKLDKINIQVDKQNIDPVTVKDWRQYFFEQPEAPWNATLGYKSIVATLVPQIVYDNCN